MRPNAGFIAAQVPDSCQVVSVDIFDTLLLRCRRSDDGRMLETARLQAALLRETGHDLRVEDLFAARRELQSLVYRGYHAFDPSGDVGLDRLLGLQSLILGLPEEALPTLRQAELTFEARNLRPNRELLAALSHLVTRGKRCIAVSDTPLSGEQLRDLIQAVAGATPISRVYSSADEAATKHDGAMFDLVAHSERVAGAAIFHFGDNTSSDVVMARSRGWQACHLPRTKAMRFWRKVDGFVSRRRLASPLR